MNFSRLHTLRLQEWRNRDVEQNSLQEFDDIREPGDNSDHEDTRAEDMVGKTTTGHPASSRNVATAVCSRLVFRFLLSESLTGCDCR